MREALNFFEDEPAPPVSRSKPVSLDELREELARSGSEIEITEEGGVLLKGEECGRVLKDGDYAPNDYAMRSFAYLMLHIAINSAVQKLK